MGRDRELEPKTLCRAHVSGASPSCWVTAEEVPPLLICTQLRQKIKFYMAQVIKNLPAMQETWVWSLSQEDRLEKGVTTHSSILVWRIPWTEEPDGLQSMGLQKVRHDWATNTFTSTLIKWNESHSVVTDSLWPQILQASGVGSLSLLQGIFPTEGLNPGLSHCRWIFYWLSHKWSPRILEWVAYPFSRGSSWPRNRTRSPALQADSLPTELWGKLHYHTKI